ncbi:RDD family protein [Salinimicrobium sp. MT39]|uniref:RDD family protein n=1 Tax=Salinimicrobium profundisediminis TaxID=2994553 RepID=A0A9X3CZ53_9FLAO|nr:RDD family protein [Salinimicrobium profundisediminis]MCX2839324.1 RDD family protein [Salinimicrobium profundisediminis]
MDNFQIETAQNISITQNVAGVGERILAYLIDGLMMLAYVIIVTMLMGGLDGNQGQEWLFMSVVLLPLLLYFLLWESLWNGQSPGKAALQLRVVKLDGSKPAFSNYMVRWLLRIVDITITSGSVAVVTILLNGKGQRLGDLAAGTTVISERVRTGLDNTLLVNVPDDYRPVYPQVTMLSDRDVQEIKEIYRSSLASSNYRVIAKLSNRVSDLLGVTPEDKPVQFLKTVLKDYSYYTRQ